MLNLSNLNLSHDPTLNLSQGPVFDSIKKKKKILSKKKTIFGQQKKVWLILKIVKFFF